MSKSIAYHSLRQFLLGLGFKETPLPKAHVQFEEPSSGTLLLFRALQDEEPVPPATLVIVRKMLVDNGLMERTALERRLEEMAGSTPREPKPGRGSKRSHASDQVNSAPGSPSRTSPMT